MCEAANAPVVRTLSMSGAPLTMKTKDGAKVQSVATVAETAGFHCNAGARILRLFRKEVVATRLGRDCPGTAAVLRGERQRFGCAPRRPDA